MNTRTLRWALPLALAGAALAADPVLRIVRGGPDDAALLANGNFAAGEPAGAAHWRPAPGGCAWAAGEGRGGSPALRCESPAGEGWFGASQAVVLNRATGPLVVSGWSKAEGVGGHVGSDYSLYVDLVYADGTPLWGRTGNFRCGTHDWERREFVIVPEKPVGTLTLHCLFRGRAGRAWFDDVGVAEIRPGAGATVFQGLPVQPAAAPAAPAPPPEAAAPAGDPAAALQATVGDQRVVSLRVGGTEWIGAGPAGFMARDAAADSDFFGVGAEPVPGQDLAITAFSATPGPDHVLLDARLVSTRPQDRAVTLVHALPVAGGDWRWGDDLRRSRATAGGGEFTQVAGVQAGATGGLSVYPIAAVWNDRVGLALGVDLGRPALYRVGYHAALGMLFVACDLGLVGDTRECPHGADLRVVLFRFDPRWGFRGAWQKYMEIFPDYFAVRARDQGLWMPFTDVSTVAGWEDFGFRFHEGDNNVPWDDAHGVLSFRYTEPMTWWMAMDPALPRTPAAALQLRGQLARGADAHGRRMAQAAGLSGMLDEAGEPCLQFHDTPWCNGAVWSLNPNPWLDAPPPDEAAAGQPAPEPAPNAATVHWNPALRERLYGPQARGRLDGEYLDSLEGYVTAELNFRREHFRHSTVPLTFDAASRRPALFKGLAVFEFTRWMAADVHRMGGLMFANSVPHRFSFLCPWLDVLGTETNWMGGADYQPAPLEQMDLWRTCSGAKPYLLLMNTDYDRFTPERVERYFQRALFYGMFPGMFSHNAADNPYWQTPKWYNRDRPLFRRYLPVVKRVAEAGWHPVPHATCENPRVLLERFGPDAAGHVFLTVFNDTPEPQAGTVQVDRQALGLPAAATPRELLSGASPEARGTAGWAVQLQPQQVAVLHLDPAATGNAD